MNVKHAFGVFTEITKIQNGNFGTYNTTHTMAMVKSYFSLNIDTD